MVTIENEKNTVVVSQPMFFPWAGMFEQIRLADTVVHYDDVQMPRGRSFISRVQLKTKKGQQWMTAPIDRVRSGAAINETWLVSDGNWRESHLQMLHHHYAKTPHFNLMFELAKELYGFANDNLADFNIHCIEKISSWLGLHPVFVRSSKTDVPGASSQRLLDLCKKYGASAYVTGLGAMNYIDYGLFEAEDVNIRYMAYEKKPYPQCHGEFVPYVSILDAIANCGSAASELLCSHSTYWKEYINEPV